MNRMVKKAAIAALAMGTSIFGMVGVTFAGSTSSTTSASTPFWTDITNGGSFDGPYGIAVDSAGNLYVTNDGNNTIMERKSGSATWTDITNGGSFNTPSGIAVDSAGDLFVTNLYGNTVEERKSGSTTWTDITNGGSFDGPYGIAVNSAGDLFVTNAGNNTIMERPNGSATWTDITNGGSFNFPEGIAVDRAGDLFVVDYYNTIFERASGSTTWTDITNGGSFNTPSGIAVDGAGDLFVTNAGNNTIMERMSGSSTWTDITNGGPINNPVGIAADSVGDLFVTNAGSQSVEEHLAPASMNLNTLPAATPGTVEGTTAVTAVPNTTGDTLEYALSTQPIAAPVINSPLLRDVQGSEIVNVQTSNLLYDTHAGDYIGVYEVKPSTSQVVAFSQVGPLTSSDIAVANVGLPLIATVPSSLTETEGTTPQALSVFVESVRNPGTLSYQWYSNTIDSNSGGTAILRATNNFYIPSTTTVGTTYYYVVVTNTKSSVNGTLMASNTSSAIPVTVTSHTVDTLSRLTVSMGALSPAFTSQVTSYKDRVDNSVSSIALTPTVTDPTESVTVSVYGNPVSVSSGSYNVPLQVGDNPIEVKVKGQSGLSQTYTVDVQRASTPLTGQLPEVPFAAGLPLLGLAGAGAVWYTRRSKGKRA